MGYLILVGAIFLVLITGFIKVVLSVRTLVNKHNFVHDYREKFGLFASTYLSLPSSVFENQTQQLDWQQYHWLVSNMDKTQEFLGSFGIANYRAAFDRFHIPNYPYIINTVPQIRMNQAERVDILMCDDMMVRYLGAMIRSIDDEKSRAKNPLTWLQQGIQFYIGFPLRLFNWFGIISDSSFSRITSSQFFKVLAGIGALAAFIASLIQILQAWPFIISLF